jgi:hypothetical protein
MLTHAVSLGVMIRPLAKVYRNQQTNSISSVFICVHLCSSVVPTPKFGFLQEV